MIENINKIFNNHETSKEIIKMEKHISRVNFSKLKETEVATWEHN